MSTTTIITRPDTEMSPADIARRLARITEQHTPYNDALNEATGVMCRECGYVDPCPTRRMCDQGDPEGHWLRDDEL